MEETVKSYAEELLEQAVEDALIEEDAKFVVALVRSDNISIDEALVKLNIKEYLIRDVRFLAE